MGYDGGDCGRVLGNNRLNELIVTLQKNEGENENKIQLNYSIVNSIMVS